MDRMAIFNRPTANGTPKQCGSTTRRFGAWWKNSTKDLNAMTADAVIFTLRHVWRALLPLNIPMAVMGGIALASWKHVRATRDVDLLLGIDAKGSELVRKTLVGAGLRAKPRVPDTTLGDLTAVPMLYEPPETYLDLQVDLLLGKGAYHQNALQRRVSTPLPGMDLVVDVLTCEDLILHKLLAGRIIDLADAAALLRINEATVDRDYLRSWVATLELKTLWSQVENEAFPP